MSFAAQSPPDLPPRTWHGWWLEWPKWFRIGCWAGVGMALLHVALAVRIYVGLQDPAEVRALRRPGVHISYASDRLAVPFPLSWVHQWMLGVQGRSRRDVVGIRLDEHGTDADLELIGRSFPNLESLHLQRSTVSARGLVQLIPCQNLRHIDLNETDLDDEAAEILRHFPQLSVIDLTGTLIGDAALNLLADRPLSWLNVSYTDVSLEAVTAIRAWQPGGSLRIGTEKDGVTTGILGSIRWADGACSGRFAGNYELRVTGPIVDGRSTGSFATMSSNLLRSQMWWDTKQFQGRTDGVYHFTVKLGEITSAPAEVTIQNGAPSVSAIKFVMPCTRDEALRSAIPIVP